MNKQSPRWQPVAPYFLLVALALTIWHPLLAARVSVADDFSHSGLIESGGFTAYWNRFGVWRLVGHPVLFVAGDFHALLPGAIAFLTHLATTFVVFAVIVRLGVKPANALASSCIFLALPFGFQALIWSSAYPFAISTLLALIVIYLALNQLFSHESFNFVALFVVSFLAVASHEAVLGTLGWCAFLPIAVLFDSKLKNIRNLMKALLYRTLPTLAGLALWILLYKLLDHGSLPKTPTFNPTAFISGIYYQYFQSTYLLNIGYLTSECGRYGVALSFFSGLITFVYATTTHNNRNARNDVCTREPGVAVMLWGCLLPFAAVSIYAIGGGFSLDSRKAYAIWPFIMIALTLLFGRVAPAVRVLVPIATAVCLTVFGITTVGVLNCWHTTSTKYERAYALINAKNVTGRVNFQDEESIYDQWPDFEYLCGFRFDDGWIVSLASGRELEVIEDARNSDSQATVIRFQPSGEWIISN